MLHRHPDRLWLHHAYALQVFTAEQLADAVGQSPDAAQAAIDRLVAEQLVEADPSGFRLTDHGFSLSVLR